MISEFAQKFLKVAKLQLLSVIVGFASQIFLARYLGPALKGQVDLFILIPTLLASLLDGGITSSNMYFSAKGLISTRKLHSLSMIWSSVLMILVIIFVMVFRSLVESWAPGLPIAMLVVSFSLSGFVMYANLSSSLLLGGDRVHQLYIINAFTAVATFIVYIIIAFRWPHNAMMFCAGTAIVLVGRSIANAVMVNSFTSFSWGFDTEALKQSLRYGVALYIGLMCNNLHFRLNQFFVNDMLGATGLGIYSLSIRIAELIWLLDYAVVNASIFRITSSQMIESAAITQQATRLLGFIIVLFCIAVGATAPFVIPLVLGEAFAPSVWPLILLLPGILTWSLARILAQFIAYQTNRPWFNTRAAGYALILNVVLNLICIPKFGLPGAAIATTCSYAFHLILITVKFHQLSGTSYMRTFIPQKNDFQLLWRMAAPTLSILSIKK